MKFTEKDIKQIESKSISIEKVNAQLALFKTGIPFVNLQDAATINHGILKLSETEKRNTIAYFENHKNSKSILKFVPASGAATRMFKFLFQFLETYDVAKETIDLYVNKTKSTELSSFFKGLEKLPFYQQVGQKAKEYFPNYHAFSSDEKKVAFVKTMLDTDKLNFSFFPKGLLPFHPYKNHVSTAFAEHLFEAALYATSNGKADLHFTISEKHKNSFEAEFKRVQKFVEAKTNTEFNISFSYQCQSTDTIAVAPNNDPFRDQNNKLLFRPSGHGALINNLNQLDADVVFIKNIDNVVVFKYENVIAEYKKMLGGILMDLQEQAFSYVKQLEKNSLTEKEIITIAAFLKNKLHIVINKAFEKYSKTHQIEYLKEKLDRPIRVCGMVKNEGEPGGGPFWVKSENGDISLQIVESAQIDVKNIEQEKILKNATHFNPVDLVCGIKNYKGEKFDFGKFVDPKTAFITQKTQAGKELKALELPGLWNGAMAYWNTIFVEVPLRTFNPVKTVKDLLKEAHQID